MTIDLICELQLTKLMLSYKMLIIKCKIDFVAGYLGEWRDSTKVDNKTTQYNVDNEFRY